MAQGRVERNLFSHFFKIKIPDGHQRTFKWYKQEDGCADKMPFSLAFCADHLNMFWHFVRMMEFHDLGKMPKHVEMVPTKCQPKMGRTKCQPKKVQTKCQPFRWHFVRRHFVLAPGKCTNHGFSQGCATCCSLAAGLQGNEEMEGEWGNGDRGEMGIER